MIIETFSLIVTVEREEAELEFMDIDDPKAGPDGNAAAAHLYHRFIEGIPEGARCDPNLNLKGDLPAKMLLVWKDGETFGAWPLYQIRITGEDEDSLWVSVRFAPALPGGGTPTYDQYVTGILAGLQNRSLVVTRKDGGSQKRWIIRDQRHAETLPAELCEPFVSAVLMAHFGKEAS